MKEGVKKFVKIIKRIFTVFSIVILLAFMVSAVFALNGFFAFYFIASALLLTWLVAYGFYEMRVSMGAVIGIEVTDKVIHLKTQRKIYTYDVKEGCENVKICKNKFIGTFVTENSRDKFIFYRRVLFTPYRDEQFTIEDIASFYPPVKNTEVV